MWSSFIALGRRLFLTDNYIFFNNSIRTNSKKKNQNHNSNNNKLHNSNYILVYCCLCFMPSLFPFQLLNMLMYVSPHTFIESFDKNTNKNKTETCGYLFSFLWSSYVCARQGVNKVAILPNTVPFFPTDYYIALFARRTPSKQDCWEVWSFFSEPTPVLI